MIDPDKTFHVTFSWNMLTKNWKRVCITIYLMLMKSLLVSVWESYLNLRKIILKNRHHVWVTYHGIKHVHNSFGDVESFINTADFTLASKSKLQSIFSDSKKIKLMIELAVTVDRGKLFIKATYYLERDDPLVLTCYEKMLELKESSLLS